MYNINYTEIPCKDRTLSYIMNYCLGSAVAIVLFDINKINSFSRAEKVYGLIEQCNIPINIVVATKVRLIK